MMRGLALAALQMLLAVSLAAADLTGTWIGLLPGQGRRLSEDISVKLVQRGNQLSGKLYGDSASSPIVEGGLDERGNLWFVVETREQAGNQINIVEYRFKGDVCGESIEITRERASARDALTGAPAPVRRPDDTDEEDHARRFHSFWLERLY